MRARDRRLWAAEYAGLPDGTVVVGEDRAARLKHRDRLLRFTFDGWVSTHQSSSRITGRSGLRRAISTKPAASNMDFAPCHSHCGCERRGLSTG